jgi:uncharacterized membrane protein
MLQESVTLGEGESLKYQGFEIRFENFERSGYSLDFEDSDGVLIDQLTSIEFFEQLGQWKNLSEDVKFKPVSVDREENELKAKVRVPEGSLGKSSINFTAPNYIVKQAGEDFTVPIKIENEGGVEEAYEIEADSEGGISTSYHYQGYNITKIVVEPGKEKTVNTEIDLDEELRNGLYDVNFTFLDESLSSKSFSFQVINSSDEDRSLSMRLGQSYVEKAAGKEISTEFRVRNLGESNVEDVRPELSVPENWNYSVSPEEAENISSDEFQDFELDIGVPSTATSGDYFVDIGLENTEDFDKKNIRVNVSSQSSGLGIFGIILALLAVVLVGGVYKVFGRR